ncbi:MAG: hypothetical protein COT71_02675 [Candidatus Andersenbacteria bacterium CG10_big_fil_rev_8_21_14_0_10_54_11]|uniref:Uncharacterized protein n=1 Tax=Candidatus Andersenbacteria bacterium CG10_big_fil_rev_8_21_14_0_10_54_11 TaxID=1974485 RepID=A0A2M6WZA1_9BACT|nr:MAG: hypothetical protein COT71_02675 [Candidatus Andersenbacteria bacterium CG10_big_fil_rev_8_21_14_0_10_54_11]
MNQPSHTPQFIAEMKANLKAEQQQLNAEVAATKEFPDYGRHEEENATEVADYQAAAATEDMLSRRREEVEAALQRIDAGTYGITNDGQLIPEERLRANPAATTTVS